MDFQDDCTKICENAANLRSSAEFALLEVCNAQGERNSKRLCTVFERHECIELSWHYAVQKVFK